MTPPPANSKFKLPILISLIIFLIIVGTVSAAYLFLNTNKQKACTMEAKICPDGSSVGRTGPNCEFAPCPTPKPETDPTANWQTYTNSDYGFSFKHPNLSGDCCKISGPITGTADEIITLGDYSTGREGSDAPFDGLSVSVEPNIGSLSLDQYVNQEKQGQSKNPFCGGVDAQSTSTLAQRRMIRLSCKYNWEVLITSFPNNREFLVINMTEASEDSFKEVFEQILSTFTFIALE